MFDDLCYLSDTEMWLFTLACFAFGAIVGILIAGALRHRDSVEHVKVGCHLSALFSLVSGYATARWVRYMLPDSSACGITPDGQFLLIYAALFSPLGLLAGIWVWHLAIKLSTRTP